MVKFPLSPTIIVKRFDEKDNDKLSWAVVLSTESCYYINQKKNSNKTRLLLTQTQQCDKN